MYHTLFLILLILSPSPLLAEGTECSLRPTVDGEDCLLSPNTLETKIEGRAVHIGNGTSTVKVYDREWGLFGRKLRQASVLAIATASGEVQGFTNFDLNAAPNPNSRASANNPMFIEADGLYEICMAVYVDSTGADIGSRSFGLEITDAFTEKVRYRGWGSTDSRSGNSAYINSCVLEYLHTDSTIALRFNQPSGFSMSICADVNRPCSVTARLLIESGGDIPFTAAPTPP
jgi:hypothetical protein